MNNQAPSLWPVLIPAIPSLLLALAALWGWRQAKTKQPADVRLLWLQGDVQEATRAKLEAERESLAVASLERAVLANERRVEKLEADVVMWKDHAGRAEERAERAEAETLAMVRQVEQLKAYLKSNGLEYPS